jgi:hypothetical protein
MTQGYARCPNIRVVTRVPRTCPSLLKGAKKFKKGKKGGNLRSKNSWILNFESNFHSFRNLKSIQLFRNLKSIQAHLILNKNRKEETKMSETNTNKDESSTSSRKRGAAAAAVAAEAELLALKPSGGAYVPPMKLRALRAAQLAQDKSSESYQRFAWDQLKKCIHGQINKVNTGNIVDVARALLHQNLLRGK